MKINFMEFIIYLAIAFMLGMAYQSAEYAKQPKRYIDTIVVHHSINEPDSYGKDNYDISAAEIDSYHKSKGWDGVGYHYIIRRTGKVEMGRDLSKVGAHKKEHNKFSIGICLSGNTATKAQIKALYTLCRRLHRLIPEIQHIDRHRLNTQKNPCPGPSVDVEELEQGILGK